MADNVYTPESEKRIIVVDEFQWDEANVEHIARHGITPEEAEEAYLDENRRYLSIPRTSRETRRALLGKTEDGRILFLVYTLRLRYVRILSTRDATSPEKRQYRKK
ncbi:MAG: BrnT family toxin [Chloroflexota bacterium]